MTFLLLFKNLSHLIIGLTFRYTFDPGHESSSWFYLTMLIYLAVTCS